jgi:hypothetical protein
MSYKNDWFKWTYDGNAFGARTSTESIFDIEIKPTVRSFKTFKEELLNNTRQIRDTFSEPLDLFFSGGVDSEVILRCHIELKIPINVIIVKYENEYNALDLMHALRICNELNVTPKIIDFNLEKFFENEAYDIWSKGMFLNSGRLPHMKMLEYSDNIPIMGDANPTWFYDRGVWRYLFREVDYSQSVYAKITGRDAVLDWYQHSPEVLLAHALEEEIITMRSKFGTMDDFEKTKYRLNSRIWPSIKIRPKRVGFEGKLPFGHPMSKPEFMLNFNQTHITFKNTHISFTEEDFFNRMIIK